MSNGKNKEMDEEKGREAFQTSDVWSLVTNFCVDIIAPDSLLWVREQHRCCCAVAAILGIHRSDSALGLTQIVLLFDFIF